MSQPVERYLRRPLIWITDDSPVEARITQQALGTAYEFEQFRDGAHVVERLAHGGRQPDVLLLDWVMPGMMGDEVCRFLRAQPATAELPIILVTASRVETADVVEGLSIGANDYVARPFVAEELRARVETAIRAKRLRELAARERNRLAAIGRLGSAFVEAGPRIDAVLDALAEAVVTWLADGCAISLVAAGGSPISIARHRATGDARVLAPLAALADPCVHAFSSQAEALATLPAAYHGAIHAFGMSGLAVLPFPEQRAVHGMVTVTRDGASEPFEADDLATIRTCIEYAAMAIENALRFDAERTARAHLDLVLERLPISIVVVDREGNVTLANPEARELVPVLATARRSRELEQAIALRTLEGEPLALEDGPIGRALRGETVRTLELQLLMAGRPSRSLRSAAVPLRDARGEIISAVGAFEDVTFERAAAAERERMIEFQQYVLGIVGHDLRNPLASVQMGCELLRHKLEGDPQVAPIVERIQGTSRRMQGIVDQLLDVTRARLGGGIPVELHETDVAQVVAGVLDELALAYPGVVFQPRLEHVRGLWDADRLAQVVGNLVSNAIQHGAAHAPVTVETFRDGDDVVIRVRNATAGAPISKELERTIFTPFRRAHAHGHGGGLGLGLFIASEILRAHRGRISLESDRATTTFTVRLPLTPGPAAAADAHAAAHP